MRKLIGALSLFLAGTAAASQPGLPPDEAIIAALDSHPAVLAADARIEAARANARALRAGPHEFTLGGSYTRRSVDYEGDYDEYDATLSRAIRLPGKAALDRQAGALGLAVAENLRDDARHQTALLFNNLWWEWLSAAAEARIGQESIASLDAARQAVERRAQLQDASLLDVDQARSALATAELVARQAEGRATAARAALAAQFPTLPLPADAPAIPDPDPAGHDLARLRDLVIERSHEIGAARADADRQRVLGQRARRDRLADPTFGVRLFSERNGAERGIGLVASMPIGGRHRSSIADRAAAEASAAEARLAAIRFDVHAIADRDLATANNALAAWEHSRSARDSAFAAAARMRRGYHLGAIDLTDMLYAERQAQEGARAETLARAEAAQALMKLRIDSHDIWAADSDHHEMAEH
ncbi:MAG: TolC family protein [Parasphingopyxis sp.]